MAKYLIHNEELYPHITLEKYAEGMKHWLYADIQEIPDEIVKIYNEALDSFTEAREYLMEFLGD
jgi:hypothetical protein